MKYLKILLTLFIITFVLSTITTKAASGYHSYIGITLNAYKSEQQRGPQTKSQAGRQAYHNGSTENSCTGNQNELNTRVYSEANGYSVYLLMEGQDVTSYWPDNSKTNLVNSYNIYFKNNTFSPCEATHSGTWYLHGNLAS